METIRHSINDHRIKITSLFWILLALTLSAVVSACEPSSGPFTDYYVSPTGVDNPRLGRTAAEPWRTIGFALGRADYSRGTPRINHAAGIYRENLAITQPVTIIGAGVGDPLRDTGISVIEPATRPSAPFAPYHTVSGGVRAEFLHLVFYFGRVQVTGGSLHVEDVFFWYAQQGYGLRLRDVSAFNIIDSEVTTQPGGISDTAIDINNSIGEIHGGYFGDGFDHPISITKIEVGAGAELDGYRYSHPVCNVLIENAAIRGSNISFADGIRVFFDASAIIRDSTIIRDHPDAEPWREGTSDGSAAGIDLLYERGDRSSSTVEITGNRISGFDVGIAMNLGGKRVIAAENDISGVSYPVKTHYGRHPAIARADPTIDFGGGALASIGGNIFRNVGAYAFFHQHDYPVDACFNDWIVTGPAAIERRIHDQMDDSSLGRVRWDCSSAIIAETPNGTPEIFNIITETPAPQLPAIIEDTLCWKGPGSLYEVVSSIKTGVTVELLGISLDGAWWIVDSPRYPGVACWLPGDALDVDPELDLVNLPLFKAPPIPTPTATPVTGCLYQGPNDNQAVCYPIAQCPVPFDQTQGACSP